MPPIHRLLRRRHSWKSGCFLSGERLDDDGSAEEVDGFLDIGFGLDGLAVARIKRSARGQGEEEKKNAHVVRGDNVGSVVRDAIALQTADLLGFHLRERKQSATGARKMEEPRELTSRVMRCRTA